MVCQKHCWMVTMALTRLLRLRKRSGLRSFVYLAENNVMFEGILLKPTNATPEQIADYTFTILQRRIPPAFLSGGQSEVEATFNLNAMNKSPNPWHVSFSCARALQNTFLKTWGGLPESVKAAQDALLISVKSESLAQLGKYTGEGDSDEAKQGMSSEGMCTKDK
uniref:fructose-bisphosphate aldolase n=1 Tax=Solanum lycopersicum TaxID=4081 RepID=A0A3Q7JCF2_SOLLC